MVYQKRWLRVSLFAETTPFNEQKEKTPDISRPMHTSARMTKGDDRACVL